MKKYILKQDLPLAKAGTIVQVDLEKDFPKIYENKERNFKLIWVVDMDTMDKWLEEVPEKPKRSVWNLLKWDKYYIIENNFYYEHSWDWLSFDILHLTEWNIFLSYEEAEQELEKRRAIQRVKKYCWENDIKILSEKEVKELVLENIKTTYNRWWNDITPYCNYYFFIWFWSEGLCADTYLTTYITTMFYFWSREDAETVIKNCEDDLKIIFNLWEK